MYPACSLLLDNLLFRFDAVVHFAGLKAVGESVQKPLLYYDNNVIGTVNLLEVMSAHGCKKVFTILHIIFLLEPPFLNCSLFSEFVCRCMLGCYFDLNVGLLIRSFFIYFYFNSVVTCALKSTN